MNLTIDERYCARCAVSSTTDSDASYAAGCMLAAKVVGSAERRPSSAAPSDCERDASDSRPTE